jgi:hypothetical protein
VLSAKWGSDQQLNIALAHKATFAPALE